LLTFLPKLASNHNPPSLLPKQRWLQVCATWPSVYLLCKDSFFKRSRKENRFYQSPLIQKK
jgi:hypothetical protein